MANIGLSNIWWSPLTEDANGGAHYAGARYMGKAVSAETSITNNEAKLYGDDALAESDTSFSNGTITLGVTDDDDTVFAPLLGHTINDGEVIKTSSDAAPYVGVGRVVTKMVNGVYKYKVEFLYKVKFAEMSRSEQTRGESVEFTTPSVEGAIATLSDAAGTWNKTKIFTSKAEALTYLKNLLAADGATYRVTFDLMGGESATIDDETVNAGATITLDDGTGVTAPDGLTFAGWSLTPNGALLGETFTPSDDVTIYAVYTE
jgi:phi13 family phage major tail protein